MIYCPYTDREISESEANREHIIPLSLGGLDGFEIPVCKDFNSKVGSKIDGALANDFLILMKRNELDVRGHSNKKPKAVAKKSTDTSTGKPVQVAFDRHEGLKIWCPITKRHLQGERTFQSSVSLDMDAGLKFVAKVALSAGYFVYGELFRRHVRHDEIRFIMNHDLRNSPSQVITISTRVDDRFNQDENPDLEVFRMLCGKLGNSSVVGLVPGPENIGIFVGVLGHYMGMLNVPANTESFPAEGEYDLGHVVCLQNGNIVRVSFRRAIERMAEAL